MGEFERRVEVPGVDDVVVVVEFKVLQRGAGVPAGAADDDLAGGIQRAQSGDRPLDETVWRDTELLRQLCAGISDEQLLIFLR